MWGFLAAERGGQDGLVRSFSGLVFLLVSGVEMANLYTLSAIFARGQM